MSDQAHPRTGIILNMEGRDDVPINIKLDGKWHKTNARQILDHLQRQEPKPLTEDEKPRHVDPILNVHPRLKTEFWTPHECGYCGEHLADEWVFCPECGTATVPDFATEPKGDPKT